MMDEEPATADAAGLRFHNGQREHHRHSGVGGAAAFVQNFHARVAGARIGRCNNPLGKGGHREDEKGERNEEALDHARQTIGWRWSGKSFVALGNQASIPTACAMLVKPSRAIRLLRPLWMLRASIGPSYTIALYIWTSDAPARMRA